MRFTDLFIRRPVLATVVSLLIVLLGFQAWSKLPLRQYPQMENALMQNRDPILVFEEFWLKTEWRA